MPVLEVQAGHVAALALHTGTSPAPITLPLKLCPSACALDPTTVCSPVTVESDLMHVLEIQAGHVVTMAASPLVQPLMNAPASSTHRMSFAEQTSSPAFYRSFARSAASSSSSWGVGAAGAPGQGVEVPHQNAYGRRVRSQLSPPMRAPHG